MSLRRWKDKFAKGVSAVTDTVSDAVDTAKEKAGEMLDTSLTFEKAQEVLANELEKGVRIFDEIGLPQQVGDDIQEEIANYAMDKLKEAWDHPERKSE